MKVISYAIGGIAVGVIGGTYFGIWIISNIIATTICKNTSDEKIEELTTAIKRVKTEDVIEAMEGGN